MVSGIMLAIRSPGEVKYEGKTIAAATVPNMSMQMPLDLQLDLGKRQERDTIVVHDTVEKTKVKQVTKIKYIKVPKPKYTTDSSSNTILTPESQYSEAVNNQNSGVREEQTQVGLQSTKRSSVTLEIDGEVVYKTENDIHSTGDIE